MHARPRKPLLLLFAAVAALSALACGEVDRPGGATLAHFQVPRDGVEAEFTTLPWPNDIRLDPDGTVSLRGFPADSPIVTQYLQVIDAEAKGWGTNAGIFFRFDAPIDPATLPATPVDTLSPGASAYLVDIDAASPTLGQRVPLEVRYRDAPGTYIGPHSLVLLPVPGFTLRPGTTYAALLTRGIRDAAGQPCRRDIDLVRVLSSATQEDPVLEAARAAYAPLRRYLDEAGIAPTDILNAAVFTTQVVVEEMRALRQAVYRDLPTPPAAPADLAFTGSGAGYHVYEGTYEAPIYQAGEPPYSRDGGGFVFDANGRPVLQRTEPVRFALSVPVGPMPAAGWPVVLYAHGTGGSYRSHISGGTAEDLARIYRDGRLVGRAAVIGIDQVLHGTRCGEGTCNPDLDFFNFQNPVAGRDNVRQGALDNVQLLRLVKAMNLPAAPGTGAPLRFDPSRIFFMGHSQGGLTGPPFLAVEPEIPLAVLSGAGGHMILSLLSKTEPVDIPELLTLLLNESDPVDRFHPVLSLIQLFIEPADPLNYGRHFVDEPVPGVAPKQIFLSQGLVDHYTPPMLTEALAVVVGLDLVGPFLEPTPSLALRDAMRAAGAGVPPDPAVIAAYAPLGRPVSGNLAGGTVTGVLAQYTAWGDADGHYVLFDNPAGNRDYPLFLGTFLEDGLPAVTPYP